MQHRPLSHFLVACQFGGIGLACYPVGLINRGHWIGLLLCAAGAALGIAALCFNTIGNFSVYPEIKRGARLITSGPYRYVRHPMYSALVVMMAGIAVYNGQASNAVGVLLVAAAVFAKSLREDALLAAQFDDYDDYRVKTKRFVPGVL